MQRTEDPNDPDPSPVFDRIYKSLEGNPRWTLREISGGHSMNRTNLQGLAQLLLDLFPSSERAPAGALA